MKTVVKTGIRVNVSTDFKEIEIFDQLSKRNDTENNIILTLHNLINTRIKHSDLISLNYVKQTREKSSFKIS